MMMNKPVNKIEKLIEEMCPQGVEFRALGEVLERNKGTKITAAKMKELNTFDAPIKIFAGGKTFAMVNLGDIPEKDIHDVSSIIVKSRGIIEFEYYDKQFSHKNEFWSYYSKNKDVNIKYVAYYLKMKEPYFQNIASKMQMPQISLPDTEKFQIPIPPLTIQKEIVKILDNFTRLEAELEAELEARKRQYEYYREELLSFGDDVEFRALGEVGNFLRGSAITKKETTVGDIPVVANAPIPICFHGESNRTGETIVVSRSGANCGLVSFWKQPIFVTDAFSIHLETALLKPKFIYYFLKKNQKTIHSMKKGYGVPHVRVKDFESYSVPIPPLSKQKEIVAILDKFDALVNDISIGLPAEITARKKQYEYYRNQLLTFKPLETQDAN